MPETRRVHELACAGRGQADVMASGFSRLRRRLLSTGATYESMDSVCRDALQVEALVHTRARCQQDFDSSKETLALLGLARTLPPCAFCSFSERKRSGACQPNRAHSEQPAPAMERALAPRAWQAGRRDPRGDPPTTYRHLWRCEQDADSLRREARGLGPCQRRRLGSAAPRCQRARALDPRNAAGAWTNAAQLERACFQQQRTRGRSLRDRPTPALFCRSHEICPLNPFLSPIKTTSK